MIEETILFTKNNYPSIRKIGILSTTGTYKSQVYYKALSVKNYEVVLPTLQIQETLIHDAIYSADYGIKCVSNPISSKAYENLNKGLLYLKEQGAEAVILGCTEIPLAITQKQIFDMITIDPTDVLARALLKNYMPKKLKQL